MSAIEMQKKLNPPKNKRKKRAMEKQAPKVIENPKTQIVLRSTKTSPVINEALRDLHKLQDPLSKCLFRRLENTVPFENLGSIKFLAQKNDCSLFVFGSHNKKRPNNLVFGRLFDFELLDMFEFSLNPDTFVSTLQFSKFKDPDSKEKAIKSFRFASKPAIIFQGGDFENNYELKEIRMFFLDYFKGLELKKLDLLGLDHVIIISAFVNEADGSGQLDGVPTIFFRHYQIEYQTSNNPKVPYVYLRELGPSMDLTLRRYETGNASQTKFKASRSGNMNSMSQTFDTTGSSLMSSNNNNGVKKHGFNKKNGQGNDLMKKALVSGLNAKKKILNKKPKQKNVFLDKVFNERRGKLFINQSDQDLTKLKTKKVKALRKMLKKSQDDTKRDGIAKKFGNKTNKLNKKFKKGGKGGKGRR